MLCPDTTEFSVEGTGLFESTKTYFEVVLSLKDGVDPSILENTMIMTSF